MEMASFHGSTMLNLLDVTHPQTLKNFLSDSLEATVDLIGSTVLDNADNIRRMVVDFRAYARFVHSKFCDLTPATT